MSDKQNQTVREGSTALQVQGNMTIGLSYNEVKEVFLDLYQANNYQVQTQLRNQIDEKVQLLSYMFSEKLEAKAKAISQDVDSLKEKIHTIDFQSSANNSLKQMVCKGEDSLAELLSDLLVEKITTEKTNFHIEDAISSLEFITKNDINFISLYYIFQYKIYSPGRGIFKNNYYEELKQIHGENTQNFVTQVKQYTEYFINFDRSIYKYFLSLDPQPVDFNYLLSKGWFYGQTYRSTNIFGRGIAGLRHSNGAVFTLDEYHAAIPEAHQLLSIFDPFRRIQDNPLSAIGELVAELINEETINKI
ncbi:LPO_1073/Vpar_1526 family protein [Acinetobacter johnsonii]|uniref:LPO_1073/Vpar_1526 family protein n=1 Tax=Acinetobacter johnsonii TaxID=40214 RepID=UPI0007B3FC06|nr:LPO_1073/Vpar_1526 family protein [Acinetobacter johnsonii]